MKTNFVIGVLGGMGTYATIQLFKQYAEIFEAEKEWDRPRIIIDNRCTMPSRVRAYMYHENVDQLVDEMSDSIQLLLKAGCSRIILACNTSHLFLPYIYQKIPEVQGCILNIIDTCINTIKKDGIRQVYLLATEGTIDARIYQRKFAEIDEKISCLFPQPYEYAKIRMCIEAVKQNKYSEEIRQVFVELINRYESCILGCTELPILYEKYSNYIKCKNVYDPLKICLMELRREYNNEQNIDIRCL